VTLLNAGGGGKAEVSTPRRVIGRMLGCAVRLTKPTDTLIVAEGVETALSVQLAFARPAWALLSAVNLARFEPPAHVSRLVIGADHDGAGIEAARTLRARLGASIACVIAPPPGVHKDWNEWLRASRRSH
jgi:putative DNA primase/helicase